MIFTVPTFSEPFYRQTTTLDGVPYVFDFAFNMRTNTWTMHISATDGTPLASGIKLITNFGLLGGSTNLDLPPGELVVYTGAQDTSPPGQYELGKGLRCELLYFDPSEGMR